VAGVWLEALRATAVMSPVPSVATSAAAERVIAWIIGDEYGGLSPVCVKGDSPPVHVLPESKTHPVDDLDPVFRAFDGPGGHERLPRA
jgi:hypothetical protein